MNEANKATARLLIRQMDTLTDSQFLAYFAMQVDSVPNVMNEYIARKLDMIALRLSAEEAKDGR